MNSSLLTETKGRVFELSLYVTKYRKTRRVRLQNFQDNVGVGSYGSTLNSPYTPFTLSSAEDSRLSYLAQIRAGFAAIIGGYSFHG